MLASKIDRYVRAYPARLVRTDDMISSEVSAGCVVFRRNHSCRRVKPACVIRDFAIPPLLVSRTTRPPKTPRYPNETISVIHGALGGSFIEQITYPYNNVLRYEIKQGPPAENRNVRYDHRPATVYC